MLIGREDEIQFLEARLEVALQSRGACVFVRGDLGVGKTAVVRAVAERARARGFSVLEGRAWPVDAGLAYAPLLEALGPALRALDAGALASIVEGLPDLGRLFTWLPVPPPGTRSDPGLAKTRLFESVARLVERLAARAPLLLVVEDLHDADEPTLELFHYLMRNVAPLPLLVVCTVRGGASGASPRLRRVIASLERTDVAQTVDLDPLGAEAVRALAADELGGPPDDTLLDLLLSRSQGVPLFVVALLEHLRKTDDLLRIGDRWFPGHDADAVIPPDLWQMFEEALLDLPPAERNALELLATAAEPLAHDILGAAWPDTSSGLLDAVRGLRRRGLIVEHSEGEVRYDIAHPLVRQVAYENLSAVTRRRLHAALLDARRRRAPHDLGRLARHYRGLGTDVDDEDRAVDVLVRAAAEALGRHAHSEAARWLSAALPMVRDGAGNASLPRILDDLGRCYATIGEVHAAVELWQEAVVLYDHAGKRGASAELRALASKHCFEIGRVEEAERLLAVGIAQLEADGPSPALARLRMAEIDLANRRNDGEAVVRIVGELLAPRWTPVVPNARYELHLAATFAAFVRLLESIRSGEGGAWWSHYERGAEESSQAIACARTAPERLRATQIHAGIACDGGALDEAESRLDAVAPLLEELDDPAWHCTLTCLRARIAIARGRLSEALAVTERAIAFGYRASGDRSLRTAQSMRALVLAETGEIEAAEEVIEEAAAEHDLATSPDVHTTEALCLARATLALRRGDFDEVLRALEPVEDVETSLLGTRLLRAEALARVGRTREALAFAEPLSAAPHSCQPAATAARILGFAHLARGDRSAARDDFAIAMDGFTDLGMPLEAARARLEWAAASPAPTEDAIAAAKRSLEDFRAMDARSEVERARAVLRDLGVRLAPEHRTRRSDPLSAREREVAELAAAGMTNAAIARRLFLSPHTIGSHLKHIYARLDVHSRRELARWLGESDPPIR